MNELFNSILDFLGSVERLPGLALVALASTIFGYVLKCVKRFPNEAIPVAVVLFACIANWMLATPRRADQTVLEWRSRQLLVGLVVGWLTWQLHSKVLRHIEDKIPFLRDLLSSNGKQNPPQP